MTNSRAKIEIAGLTFITAFALSFVVLVLLLRGRLARRREGFSRPPRRSRLTGRAAADWPRTTRLLPWSIAGLIAMIWLTPFDRLQLGGGGAPINITLDRVVIPIVAVIWLIAFTAGPGAAPRLKFTRVHARDRRVPGLRVPQRGPRRPLPQPHGRAGHLRQEGSAARVLRIDLRDRRQLDPARARCRRS